MDKLVIVTGISVSGTDAGNYTYNTTAITNADITPKQLNLTGITASNKVYDGTTDATIDASGAALSGVIGSDNVSLITTWVWGTFEDENAGNNKTVILSGLELIGGDIVNYVLTIPVITADIYKATPTLVVMNSPVIYNGLQQTAIITSSVSGTISNLSYAGSAIGPTNAGSYALTADFIPDDTANYDSLIGAPAGNFVIEKATPDLMVTNSPASYTGSPLEAIVESSVPGTVSDIKYNGSDHIPIIPGLYAITADFTPVDIDNYLILADASASDFVIQGMTIYLPLITN
jgi:hypothetical protein